MLTVYVETWATYVAAMARLRTDGLTMTNPDSGHTSAHPCVSVASCGPSPMSSVSPGRRAQVGQHHAAGRREREPVRGRLRPSKPRDTPNSAPKMSIGRSRDAGAVTAVTCDVTTKGPAAQV